MLEKLIKKYTIENGIKYYNTKTDAIRDLKIGERAIHISRNDKWRIIQDHEINLE